MKRRRDSRAEYPGLHTAESWLDGIVNELKADVHSSVRPIYNEDALGRPDQVGSCVLIQIAARRFLASAAHVLDHSRNGPLFVGADGDFVQLQGTILRTESPTGHRRDDAIDIGFIDITGDVAESLGGCTYFTPAEIDVSDAESTRSVYAIVGYPHRSGVLDTVQRKHKPALLAVTSVADPEAYRLLPLQKGVQLPLAFLPRKMRSGGRVKTLPNAEGISGGAVLRLDNLLPTERAPRAHKLVAIIVERRKSPRSVLVCARISACLEAIVSEVPELRRDVPVSTTARFTAARVDAE